MVREAKFSWDDADDIDPPDRRQGFDDQDDAILDPYLPDSLDDAKKNPASKNKRKSRTRPDRKMEHRHSAGTDWRNDELRQEKGISD